MDRMLRHPEKSRQFLNHNFPDGGNGVISSLARAIPAFAQDISKI
jgi:hypothetical protein